MNVKQTYIRNLRRIRRGAGLSQMQLAELCGTSTNYLGCIESSLKFPSIEMIEKIAGALRTPVYQFFLENKYMTKPPFARYLLPDEMKQNLLEQIEALARQIRKY